MTSTQCQLESIAVNLLCAHAISLLYSPHGFMDMNTSCIGSNCHGISRTVLDLQKLSQVPEGPSIVVLLVLYEVQTLVRINLD